VKTLLASPVKLIVLAAFVALLIASLFWQNLLFVSAVASSESRPALLRDAEWGTPVPSFHERFDPGTSETELLQWLSESGFELNGTTGASRRIGGMPCDELIQVSWTAVDGIIRDSSAVVTEAGCL
jgi:hypothetical protein